jgi:hypothetical protein
VLLEMGRIGSQSEGLSPSPGLILAALPTYHQAPGFSSPCLQRVSERSCESRAAALCKAVLSPSLSFLTWAVFSPAHFLGGCSL